MLSSQYLDKMDLEPNPLWCRWPRAWHYGSLIDTHMMFYNPQLVYGNTWHPKTSNPGVSEYCNKILEKENILLGQDYHHDGLLSHIQTTQSAADLSMFLFVIVFILPLHTGLIVHSPSLLQVVTTSVLAILWIQ